MEISPVMMAMLLFYSFLFGIFIGAFYDANRIIRVFFGVRYGGIGTDKIAEWKVPFLKRKVNIKSKKTSRVAVKTAVIFFGDLLCILCAGIGVVILNYSYNSGEFRFFTVIGVAIGFLLYYFTVGRVTIAFLEPAAAIVRYVFVSVIVVFLYPLYIIGKNILKLLSKTAFLYTFTLEKRKERVYNIREEVYLLKMSKNGFLN